MKRKSVSASSGYGDLARFGEDAERPIILLKIPATLASLWQPMFENGGVEGAYGLDPQVLLGTITNAQGALVASNQLADGDLVHISDNAASSAFKLSFKKQMGAKMRIISSEVSREAEHVKFEGYVAQTGALTPANLDESLRASIREQVLEAERKPVLSKLSAQGERDAMMASTYVGNLNGGASGNDGGDGGDEDDEDDDDDEEEVAAKPKSKSGKQSASSAAAAAGAGAGAVGPANKKRKKEKKEKKEWSAEAIRMELFKLFEETPFWKRKTLREHTGIQFHRMSPILEEICDYNTADKHYSLKKQD
ncbi:hypothetical protein BASA81_007806 [Batrachochytrium salamandrivorans]|nr:hypothetical protein BASA81_007806 [Batrachochytrium salamandrivorans]